MRRPFVSMWLGSALLVLVGCGADPVSAPAANSAAQRPDWQLKEQELKNKLRVGMTQPEVVQALGEPAQTKALVRAGEELILWSYPLGSNLQFVVRFDSQGRVLSFKAASAVEIRG